MTLQRARVFCAFFLASGALSACGGGATVGSGGNAGGGPVPVVTASPVTGGNGGGTSTAPAAGSSSSPGASSTPQPGASATASAAAEPSPEASGISGSDQPKDSTSSEQTFGLTCSPAFVVSAGGYSSCNMQWIEHIGAPTIIGGESIGGHYVAALHTFFLTNWESGFYAFDTTNPLAPQKVGDLSVDLGNIPAGVDINQIENEETSVNERIAVLSRTYADDAIVVDTHDPANMKILATVPSGDGHTYACLADCTFAYGASPNLVNNSTTGDINLHPPALIDLTNPSAPAVAAKSWDAILDPTIYYHYMTEIKPGLVATASNPVYFIDTTQPANPKLLFALPASSPEPNPGAIGPSQSGHVGHSIAWPNRGNDKFFLGQNEIAGIGRCEMFPDDGRTLYSYDTTGWQTTHDFNLSGAYTLTMGDADQGLKGGIQEVDTNGNPSTIAVGTPEGCSSHWFDVNANFNNGGLVAMASFSFGVRMLNVASNGQIQQVGWFVPSGISDTVGVYWITPRILYAVDFETGGIDVLQYNGPLQSGPLPLSRARAKAKAAR